VRYAMASISKRIKNEGGGMKKKAKGRRLKAKG
jgi:hypothetical protein